MRDPPCRSGQDDGRARALASSPAAIPRGGTEMTDGETEGLRDQLRRQGEDALGKLAQDLLENPLVNSAISRAFEARERAVQAQEAAMGALNIPSAADIERLTRRLRQVSQRLEGIEDGVDGLSQRLDAIGRGSEPGIADRLATVEAQL